MPVLLPVVTTVVAAGLTAGTVAVANSIKIRRTTMAGSVKLRRTSMEPSDRHSVPSPPPVRPSARPSARPSSPLRPSQQLGSFDAASSCADVAVITDADLAVQPVRVFSPLGLICSKFVVSQVVFNVICSFGPPLLCFALLFGQGGPYHWLSGEVLGPIIASPIAGCLAALAFLPISMPEMVAMGWYGVVKPEDVRCASYVFPFLGTASVWRMGFVRHLVISVYLSLLTMPPAIVVVSPLVFGPELPAWTLIWTAISFITILPLLHMPLGMLAFALEPNYERVEQLMVQDANPIRQVLSRAYWAPRC